MALKQLFFQKNYKKSPAAGGFAPRPPSMIRFNHSTLLYSAHLPILTFSHFNCWFKPFPLSEFPVTCQHQATAFDLPFYDIFASKKIPLSKFLMRLLHVICGLGPLPQSKILATPMLETPLNFKVNNHGTDDPNTIANQFNNYFCTIGSNLAKYHK